jgi:hypothetical protein
MAAYKGPRIITNNLVMQLDAADTRSYPTTGTLWSDVSQANNFINATLIGSPTFNTSYNGFFTFNGTTQYANVATSTILSGLNTSLAVSSWINISAYPTTGFRSIYYSGQVTTGNVQSFLRLNFATTSLEVGTYSGTSPNVVSSYAYSNLSLNKWYNIVGQYTGTAWELYVNGLLANSYANTTGPTNVAGNLYAIGAEKHSATVASSFFSGSIGSVYVHSAPLTNEQVLQNFIALRGRYLV